MFLKSVLERGDNHHHEGVRPRKEADDTSKSCKRTALERAALEISFPIVERQEVRTKKEGYRSDLGWYMWVSAANNGTGGCELSVSMKFEPRLLLIKTKICGSEVTFLVGDAQDLSHSGQDVRAC